MYPADAVTWHTTHSYVWMTHVCDMTHSYVCHDELICLAWLVHMCAMTHSYVCHDSFICVMMQSYGTWLTPTGHDAFLCDMTHSYVTWLIPTWHDSFVCDTTHSYVIWRFSTWHDSFIRDMTHSYMTWLTPTFFFNVYAKRGKGRMSLISWHWEGVSATYLDFIFPK